MSYPSKFGAYYLDKTAGGQRQTPPLGLARLYHHDDNPAQSAEFDVQLTGGKWISTTITLSGPNAKTGTFSVTNAQLSSPITIFGVTYKYVSLAWNNDVSPETMKGSFSVNSSAGDDPLEWEADSNTGDVVDEELSAAASAG